MRRTRRADGRGWALRAGALALILGAACVSPEMRESDGRGSLSAAQGAPEWVGQPLDWSKLESIERWLERDSGRYAPYWRVQGELTLGEGRLTYALRERSSPTAGGEPSRAWLARLQGARVGFQRVVTNPEANELQTDRARRGLEQIDGLVGGLASADRGPRSGYVPRARWGARPPIPSRLNDTVGGYDRITIHHSADVPGVRFDGSLEDSVLAMRKVQRTHVDVRAYGDIGYHFLVDAAGRVFEGRDLRYQGAHAGGNNNLRNIGVCLLGNFERSRPSAEAMAALEDLLVELRREHGITRGALVGHGELKSTACPGPTLARWTRDYRASGPRLSQLSAQEQSARPRSAVHGAELAAGGGAPRRAATHRSGWSGGSSVVR